VKTVIPAPGGRGGHIYIGPDGTLYLVNAGIFAFKPDLTEKWRVQLDGPDALAINSDGTLYITGRLGVLAMNPDGTQRWVKTFLGSPSSPIVSRDGTIYTTINGDLSQPSVFYALKTDGSVKWTFQASHEYFYDGPLIGADGTIYIGSTGTYASPELTRVRAFNPDGTVKWEFFANNIRSGIVMGPDGTVYVGTGDKKFYAIYTSSPGLAKSCWPMIYHDAQHTARQPNKFAPGSAAINFLLLE
jgi:outer membrane protein assembly factor BamB